MLIPIPSGWQRVELMLSATVRLQSNSTWEWDRLQSIPPVVDISLPLMSTLSVAMPPPRPQQRHTFLLQDLFTQSTPWYLAMDLRACHQPQLVLLDKEQFLAMPVSVLLMCQSIPVAISTMLETYSQLTLTPVYRQCCVLPRPAAVL